MKKPRFNLLEKNNDESSLLDMLLDHEPVPALPHRYDTIEYNSLYTFVIQFPEEFGIPFDICRSIGDTHFTIRDGQVSYNDIYISLFDTIRHPNILPFLMEKLKTQHEPFNIVFKQKHTNEMVTREWVINGVLSDINVNEFRYDFEAPSIITIGIKVNNITIN